MQLARLTGRLGLSGHDTDRLAECMLENKGLQAAVESVDATITLEQAYNVCRQIARELLGEELADLAPQMALERILLAEAEYDNWQAEGERRRAARLAAALADEMTGDVAEEEGDKREAA
ncbi:hypothetical protein J2T57_001360 [Natronocella acetinitrilica]|uniref:Uncharacterized protein n=1 Tax=Natronocella acetinitrilica TaxID=414046 RepID=A0AAE3G322_9GAMM|nr:hypothetical protein [Natronocella acetinitrilica]MCP1674258.1 hypothetical protein [Natronocella acetinitrilica]